MHRSDLQALSKDELIELVLKLQRPETNSRNSSKPPSTDRKERRENAKPGGAKPGHEAKFRALSDTVNEIVDHAPSQCLACGHSFSGDDPGLMIGEYETVELPPVSPFVVRHRRFARTCGTCGLKTKAPLPSAASGTPFGPRIHALAVYLKTFQALSYERLQGTFRDLFGLTLSQGALMNMFARTAKPFQGEAAKAVLDLRQAKFAASDETGVRIQGANAYHWVFRCAQAVVHTVDVTRAGQVVRDMMDGHTPQVWTSDRYAAQQKHGFEHQTCLAHLARDAAFAHEHGADHVPMRFKLWFGRVFDLAGDIAQLAGSTITAKRRKLETQIDAILASKSDCRLARELQAKIARARPQLLTFCSYPGEVEPTNNACERALRPSVIQRKVTNGYRAMWAAKAEAAVRTTVATAKLTGGQTFSTILNTIA